MSEASGDLPEFVRDALELDRDPAAREALALISAAPFRVTPALRSRVLAAATNPGRRFAPLFDKLQQLFDLDEDALSLLFESARDRAQWTAAPLPDVELFHFQGGPGARAADCGLVRVAAGACFPQHRHLGHEKVLVLEGSYLDEQSGRLYLPGDLHEMPPGSEHAYSVAGAGALLLAAAVVSGIEVEGVGRLSPASGG
jgi:quercetin dioxygenase-like cupin family protein